MASPGLAAHLPQDILIKIFNLFTRKDLARFLGISRHWRDAVLRHPKFFGNAVLRSTTPSAVAFFVAQVTSAPKTWDVAILVHEPFGKLETVVFPAVASRLDDVEVLTINVHASHAPAAFELLRGQRRGSGYHAGLHLSPRRSWGIQTLLIQNVDIPAIIPPALASIQRLVFAKWVPQARTTLHDLARAFPAARDVTLSDRVFQNGSLDPSEWPYQWNSLQFLSLAVGHEGLRRVLPHLPLTRIPHVSTMRTGQRALEYLLSQLAGPFDMYFKNIGRGRFAIILACRTTGLVRSFYEGTASWATPGVSPHRLLSHKVVLDQLLSLTVPDVLWNLVIPHLAECSQLSDLTLILSGPRWMSELFPEDWKRTEPLFPNLHMLTIASLKRKPVAAPEDVSRFVLERLVPQSPLQLCIQEGVAWPGPARIPPAIDSVRPVDGKKLASSTARRPGALDVAALTAHAGDGADAPGAALSYHNDVLISGSDALNLGSQANALTQLRVQHHRCLRDCAAAAAVAIDVNAAGQHLHRQVLELRFRLSGTILRNPGPASIRGSGRTAYRRCTSGPASLPTLDALQEVAPRMRTPLRTGGHICALS
ncbi:hypothetical protein AURDEDRAFT_122252 [Auricularia subglabra TFB-10046 SS5]|nr:hypothetical protein AURDEDRAFT_122252 [Auricularia subglabra TFB-10046 SS5]